MLLPINSEHRRRLREVGFWGLAAPLVDPLIAWIAVIGLDWTLTVQLQLVPRYVNAILGVFIAAWVLFYGWSLRNTWRLLRDGPNDEKSFTWPNALYIAFKLVEVYGYCIGFSILSLHLWMLPIFSGVIRILYAVLISAWIYVLFRAARAFVAGMREDRRPLSRSDSGE